MSGQTKDKIVGYILDRALVCPACARPDERGEAPAECRVTVQDVESAGEVWFCDRCGKRLY